MNVSSPRTLFVLTSHTAFGKTGRTTGFWFEELAAPWWVLHDAGLPADIAAIGGGSPGADPASLADGSRTAAVDRFVADGASARSLANPLPLGDVDVSRYDAIFLVGGHGTMWDFPGSDPLKALLEAFVRKAGVVAAVCHGVSGLLRVVDAAGEPYVKGKRVCGFANAEEAAIGATGAVPFLLEDELVRLGARYQSSAPFQPCAVSDGRLLTGQNPSSSQLVGELLLRALVLPAAAAA